ncbi:MAG: ATP-binding protein [Sulfolobaceae archaeon]|nr:ATP-binding protein [Sulfolobaceae archaeon]
MIDVYNNVKDRVERAKALAITLGKIIGYVSKHVPSKLDENESYVYISVPPEIYFNLDILGRVNILLGVIDIKTLNFVLLRVIGYERIDATSLLFDNTKILGDISNNESNEPGSLLTNVTLKCEMLTKIDVLNSNEPEASDIIIEPQSPVILPTPSIVEKALGINRGPLKLGLLDVPGSEIEVSIDLDDLNYHGIIVGTTGSGKTSLIKDIIAGITKSGSNTNVMIIDSTGDYYNMFLPPDITSRAVNEGINLFNKLYGKITDFSANVVYPISSIWMKKYMKATSNRKDLYSITKTYYNIYLNPIINYLNKKGIRIEVDIKENTISVNYKDWQSRVKIFPYYFRFKDVRRILYRLNPYFTEQASHFLNILLKRKNYESLDELISDMMTDSLDDLKIHKSTRENIIRGLYLLRETGLFDVKAARIPLRKAIEEKGVTIFDLYNSELDDFAQKIFTYYTLDRIFAYREMEMKKGDVNNRILIVIDEAHRFFPAQNGTDEDTVYVRKVAGKISTMMRLGRRRKIGFLFATHNPEDLSEIIVELSNTRIIFRIKPEIAEKLGLSKTEAKILSLESNGKAYVIAPWFRESKVKIRVPVPPPLGHYDLSRSS